MAMARRMKRVSIIQAKKTIRLVKHAHTDYFFTALLI